MSVQVRRRREAASFLATYVGAQGELLVDTTNNRVQVHDGATPGGWPAAKLADVLGRTAVADASYAALASDRTIAFTSLTAARAVTLPAASTFPTATPLLIVDESGACSLTTTITAARTGSDTINGAASVALNTPFGFLALTSNGIGRWTIVDFVGATSAQLTNRNAIINGNFAINQRAYASGATLALGAYAHDRWKAGAASTAYAFAQAVPDTAVTINAGTLIQVVEALNVAGSAWWLSWTGTATARVWQGTASGTFSAGAPATINGVTVNTLPVAGLSPGTAAAVEFTGGTLGLVQFEVALPNAGPTRFERRPIGQELALCQRYFQRWQQPPLRGGAGGGTTLARCGMALPTPMRAIPTATMNGNLPFIVPGITSGTISAIAANYSTASSIELDFTLASAAGSAGQAAVIYQSGTSSLDLGAEL